MIASKAWDWKDERSSMWFEPCEESYYLASRWKKQGYTHLLDFGCGLGRHSIFFSQQGFGVSAFDLSVDGTEHLKCWAEKENLNKFACGQYHRLLFSGCSVFLNHRHCGHCGHCETPISVAAIQMPAC